MERPDRDQNVTAKALVAFEELVRLYPTSEYAAQAREEVRRVQDNLAEHEFIVGHFYLRYGLPLAAVSRFEYLLASYPEYSQLDKVLFHLGQAYARGQKPEQSTATYERLRTEFPDSPYVPQVPAAPQVRAGDGR
jgi:outer membrane protein assembly factor BamD